MAKKTPKRRLPPFKCKAIVLCEKALQDLSTHLFSPINIFSLMYCIVDTAVVGPYQLFLELTGGSGHYRIEVEIQDLDEDLILVKAERDITLTDRSDAWIGVFEVPAFEVAVGRSYEVVVFANGELVERREISIIDGREAEDAEEQGSDES